MIEEGRAYGLMIALKHLLRTLEHKGVLSQTETFAMLDGALEELKGIPTLARHASAEAAATIRGLYLGR